MGVAVLESNELVYWGVSSFRMGAEHALLAAVVARVQALVVFYQPTVLALEAPLPVRLRASPLLASVVAAIKTLAREEALMLRSMAPAEVRKRLCGSARATHPDIVERIVQRYPHLGCYRNCGSSWKEAYWRSMFTAAGVALVCAQDISPSLPLSVAPSVARQQLLIE